MGIFLLMATFWTGAVFFAQTLHRASFVRIHSIHFSSYTIWKLTKVDKVGILIQIQTKRAKRQPANVNLANNCILNKSNPIFRVYFIEKFVDFTNKSAIFDLNLLLFGRIWTKRSLDIKFSKFSRDFENVAHITRKYAHFELFRLFWGWFFHIFIILQFDEFPVF